MCGCRIGKKDSDFLFAHDGKSGKTSSKIKLAGRDRTKVGMARKRKAEEDLIEMDDEDYAEAREAHSSVSQFGPYYAI